MKNKKNLIIVSMMIVVAVMAIGYAYFATRLSINATGNITSNWNVYFSNITSGTITGSASNASTPSVSGTTANMEANLQLPGDSITYEITLTNAGTIGAIIEDIEVKVEGSSAIIYSISGLKIGDKLAGGENKVISIKIEYDVNATSQPSVTSKSLTVTIDAVQDIGQSITSSDPVIEGELGSFARKILNSNNVQSDENIDFSQASSDTNGKGLYYTSTNTIDNRVTYYFRGNVENNYVSFAGQTWRIVRINEDGSIRLITQDTVTDSSYSENGDNAYVGYMYGTPGSSSYESTHNNKTNSQVKAELDAWYNTHLSSYAALFSNDAGFCNDRSIATSANTWESDDTALGYGINVTYYGAYNRVYKNNNPQFACPNEENDLFTLTTSSKGNKKLTNPIGLLTLDEIIYAGGYFHISNINYYLSNGDWWLTMSPHSLAEYESYVTLWVYKNEYGIGTDAANNPYGLRPVINLDSSVEVISGDGTVDNPYVINTN